ncbi:hypothetical protein TU94_30655 [Streptomyces cyaneogriseus subsp. noncyanogenus]|uniref:Uncharacterized protein n=1 Tax=Streptomyces cyaneogriseus subsp. noncyanogenus TaxID=477245 RepID=A0A0C5G8N5_9ACTN|nr:hypothetical protein TU94_30655 [Streptomyces cyaneogriseus subsp. noncyanogenus]
MHLLPFPDLVAAGVLAGSGLVGGDDVADQPDVSGAVLAGGDHGLVHEGVVAQGRFDLARFDAVSAYLDLVVGAADVFEFPVGASSYEVAGAVHPGSGGAVGVGHEPFGGDGGAAGVSAGQAGAGDVQLAGGAGRDGPQGFVQHIDLCAEDGVSQWWYAAARQWLAHGRADGRLGRAVGVDQASSGRPLLHEIGWACLARDHHAFDAGEQVGRQDGQSRGGQRHVGDGELGHHFTQGGAGQQAGCRCRDQCGTRQPGHAHLGDGGVETR